MSGHDISILILAVLVLFYALYDELGNREN